MYLLLLILPTDTKKNLGKVGWNPWRSETYIKLLFSCISVNFKTQVPISTAPCFPSVSSQKKSSPHSLDANH